MAPPSHASRVSPTVLAFTGAAVVLGAFIIYSRCGPDHPTPRTLQRSNAIHRPRGERSRLIVEWSEITSDAPLGKLTIQKNGELLASFNLASTGIPTAHEIQAICGPHALPGNFRQDLEEVTVDGILLSCFKGSSLTRHSLESIGLRSLTEAMATRDSDLVRQTAGVISSVLGELDPNVVTAAFNRFLESEAWTSAGYTTARSNDGLAETEDGAAEEPQDQSQGLKGLLYHIAEQDAKRKAYEHRGFHCEECNEWPIRGVRWHCLNCPDYDLCSACEADSRHPKTHVFAKIKIPLPVLSQPTKEFRYWYPGDPRKIHTPLDPSLSKQLAGKYHFETTEMDAMYDQFLSIANIPWPGDPNNVQAGIDSRAFRKALSSERWAQPLRPNALYDRMFAFYDTNGDGIIGFEEYLSGFSYLRGPDRFPSLRRAFNGFDIDGDGFVDRQDFIRLLRAKYEIHKLITEDMITSHENEQTQAAMEVIRSSQPISSVFSVEEIPRGETRPRYGKAVDLHGDMQPLQGTKTILDDEDSWPRQDGNQHAPRRSRHHLQSRNLQRLRDQLSRFDEILEGANVEAIGSSHQNASPERAVSSSSWIANGTTEADKDIPHDAPVSDVLWYIVEDAFHEMLDPMFKRGEEEDRDVSESRGERQRWRDEIRAVERSKMSLSQDMQAAATRTADTRVVRNNLTHQMQTSAFHAELVPTDNTSLERLEADIAQQPLEVLLNANGYSSVDHAESHAASDETDEFYTDLARSGQRYSEPDIEPGTTSPCGQGSERIHGGRQTPSQSTLPTHHELRVHEDDIPSPSINTSLPSPDPTMPQNRPTVSPEPTDDVRQSRTLEKQASKDESLFMHDAKVPSIERLSRLAQLNEAEGELQRRGGPGRLSFEEVNALAQGSNEIKGLLTGWLEWAAF